MKVKSSEPTLDREADLMRAGARYLACLDEVGRGALAGPVVLGALLLTMPLTPQPKGVRDSKLLTPTMRERILPSIEQWASAVAVGSASAEEIDALGIMSAMGLAGQRALHRLGAEVDVVLLDGNTNYLSHYTEIDVVTQVKADLTCAGVAAASIVAKCHRDAQMVQLESVYPGYGFDSNKGYASAQHVQAISELGISPVHRSSWSLPGLPH